MCENITQDLARQGFKLTLDSFFLAHFKDQDIANKICEETEPVKIKHLGRQVRGFDEEEWIHVGPDYVRRANMIKVSFLYFLCCY